MQQLTGINIRRGMELEVPIEEIFSINMSSEGDVRVKHYYLNLIEKTEEFDDSIHQNFLTEVKKQEVVEYKEVCNTIQLNENLKVVVYDHYSITYSRFLKNKYGWESPGLNCLAYKEFKPYTISGLCLYIDMTRETLSQYEKQEQFSDTIKKAKQRIENWVEENSLIGNINPTTSIFNLKNNFGWKDRQEIDAKTVNTNINTDISDLPPEALEEIAKAQGQEEVMRIVGKYRK